MSTKAVKFSKENTEFVYAIRERVKEYFAEHNISSYGNAEMVIKTIFMISLYLAPYVLLATGVFTSPLMVIIMWVLMGLGASGIGMCVMHDANHGAYSQNPTVNKYIGKWLNLLGGYVGIWKIQHNRLHHSYTNIEEHDEDIAVELVLRLSPHKKRHGFHRLQHIYGWFLYGFMTLSWITVNDYTKLVRYHQNGFLGTKKNIFLEKLLKLSAYKAFYYSVFLVIPIIFFPMAWWMVLVGFLSMHFVAGFILTSIFQLAHVMPDCEYPLPDNEGNMENNWAVHQLLTTTNFSPTSRIFSWCLGGLNYQIEHHLFPKICHVHYRKISKIVQQTAKEFDLPYYVQPTFFHALYEHMKMLRILGKYDSLPAMGN
ncbi:MAG: acyl-CoA desaturase [Bacteroidota bacterium]